MTKQPATTVDFVVSTFDHDVAALQWKRPFEVRNALQTLKGRANFSIGYRFKRVTVPCLGIAICVFGDQKTSRKKKKGHWICLMFFWGRKGPGWLKYVEVAW